MSDQSIFANIWPILAVMVAYVVISIAAQMAAYPYRKRLLDIAHDFQNDKRASAEDVKRIDGALDISMSWTVGIILPIAIVSVFTDIILNRTETKKSWIDKDPRISEFVKCLVISVFAANIIMAVINIIILSITLPIAFISQISWKTVLRGSTFRAANRVMHSR
ncbi:MAG: hypothetical protein E2598_06355 [Sphingobium sp.]|nr:hypothetical protein [Sphingobium sp.]